MNTLYILSKLFTYLVLPPGVFILLFFFAAMYAKRFRLFFLANATLFYLLSNVYVADWLLKPLEEPYNQPLHVKAVD
ncbi:MAG: YdcF family protein, partial [Epsilonproteobacteria bacterium]|nr:YdcF family protein [Campylobacterota bacterium]